MGRWCICRANGEAVTVSSWVISSNPTTYDAKHSLMENGEMDWVTKNNFAVGDTVYIYEVIPPRGRGSLVYETKVIKTNISLKEKLDDRKYWPGQTYPKDITGLTGFSRLKLVSEPNDDGLTLELLKERNFTAPQGRANMLDKNPALLSYIQKHFNRVVPEERRNWTREETIIAFNLYCKIPFNEVTKGNPLIIKVALIIGRTPSALGMKIGNLGSLDPELRKRGISGLVNSSKMDEEIWGEFNGDWNRLAFESEKILAELQGKDISNVVEEKLFDYSVLPEGTDRQATIKARVNQAFFRTAVLTAYNNKCCITGLSVPQLLVASHIIPWSVRMDTRTDPRNGLLLNSVHDKAFDLGLIAITPEYKIKVSNQIHKLLPDNVIKEWFVDYDGKGIILPNRFLPSKEYLKWHYENIFKG